MLTEPYVNTTRARNMVVENNMSTFRVEVVKLDSVEKHPNADRLDLCKVKGWQCVALRDQFKTGDLAVYIPIDSVLPPELVSKLGIEKMYSKRIKSIKLRGSLSQGMLMSLDILLNSPTLIEGSDVTNVLGITKYEIPIPISMRGIVRSSHPSFVMYTGIENIKNFPHVMIPGEEVVITEKIHGTNFRAAMLKDEGAETARLHVGSHTRSLEDTEGNLYWRGAKLLELEKQLPVGLQVFGEIYGHRVQDLHYGLKPGEIGVRLFDIYEGAAYHNYDSFKALVATLGVACGAAPVLYQGPWSTDLIKMAEGKSTLYPDQMREGIVIRPIVERWDDRVGRVILKAINDEYLLRHDATEHH